ncbi:MAG: apolipoprotein N-acyltransferase, partial [Gammaproteobacteria bacterium]|nr:apolipoprotein N-acyltransferase [Gammaproteobacteria bacterium]
RGWINRRAGAVIVLLFVSGQILSSIEWTEPTGRDLSVALVQGNIEQQTKWSRKGVQQRLNRYTEMTRPLLGQYELIVWPENSITQFYDRLERRFFKPLALRAKKKGSEIVLGVPVQRSDGRYYTSMAVAGDAERQFHKHHLVPFGEFLPLDWLLRGLIEFFDMPMSNFVSGPSRPPPLAVAGTLAAVTICYEDLFGEELLSQLPEAEILLNGSNNAWYGDSLAAHQHLEIARMRSLELGRWTLRSTTNGISAIIDPRGIIRKRSPQFEQAVVTGSVEPMRGATPYIIWGNWPVIVLMGLGLLVFLYRSFIGRGRPV